MALDGTVKVPVFGTMKKTTAAGAGIGAVILVLGIYWYRQRKATAAAPAAAGTAQVTDPAGNVCSAVNSVTGYCPGTPEDLAGQQQAAGYSPYLGGGGAGSPFGSVTGTPVATTTAFATNAAWAQAAETYMGSNGADATAAALAKYINGQQITPDQQTIVQEAIAAEGFPPVSGANGYPPSMNVIAATSSGNVNGTVTGLYVQHLSANSATLAWQPTPGATAYAVSQQSPGIGQNETPVNGTSYTTGSLKPNTTYTYFVTAVPANVGHASVTFRTPASGVLY